MLQLGAVAALAGKTLRFMRKVTKTGKLYAAINEEAIVEALKDQHGASFPAAAIILSEPIKAVGNFTVGLDVASQRTQLAIAVEAEKKETKTEK